MTTQMEIKIRDSGHFLYKDNKEKIIGQVIGIFDDINILVLKEYEKEVIWFLEKDIFQLDEKKQLFENTRYMEDWVRTKDEPLLQCLNIIQKFRDLGINPGQIKLILNNHTDKNYIGFQTPEQKMIWEVPKDDNNRESERV